jgi:uncharacterized protein (DUF2345 family)
MKVRFVKRFLGGALGVVAMALITLFGNIDASAHSSSVTVTNDSSFSIVDNNDDPRENRRGDSGDGSAALIIGGIIVLGIVGVILWRAARHKILDAAERESLNEFEAQKHDQYYHDSGEDTPLH